MVCLPILPLDNNPAPQEFDGLWKEVSFPWRLAIKEVIHSVHKYLLSAYYVPSIIPGIENTSVNEKLWDKLMSNL